MMQAAAEQQIVICGAAGPEVITLDLKGNPTKAGHGSARHLCPECALGQAGGTAAAPDLYRVEGQLGRLHFSLTAISEAGRAIGVPQARAPPSRAKA